MIVDGLDLDLTGLYIQPGHINAHDHLDFGNFPLLGQGPYPNATAWAHDIYRPNEPPVADCLRVAKPERLRIGAMRNLRAGVTTVAHHNPYHDSFDQDFPVRVVKRYGWAHSLTFEPDVRGRFEATPEEAPFLIHAAEGTDDIAAREIFELADLGVLTDRTVLIHCTGVTAAGWDIVRKRGCSVIWCPSSNLFMFGVTQPPPPGIPSALGTDSPLTNRGTFLDELRLARRLCPAFRHEPHRVLRIDPQPADWIACDGPDDPPRVVVIGGRIRYLDPALRRRARATA